MRKVVLAAALGLVLLLPATLFAQRTTASIRGTVRDATQAVLPGVTVTATNEDTGLVRSVVTNDVRHLLSCRAADWPLQS